MGIEKIRSNFVEELITNDGDLFKKICEISNRPISMAIGYAAEVKLIEYLQNVKGFSNVVKIDDSSKIKGDVQVLDSSLDIRIEVKCMDSTSGRETSALNLIEDRINRIRGKVRIKTSDSWVTSDGIKTSHPPKNQWHILAICTYPVTGKWEFLFISNDNLPRSKLSDNLLASAVAVDTELTPYLYEDIMDVIQDYAKIST
jgi:hypothetical protein